MGKERCWIQESKITELIYVYFPVSIALLVNIIFYSTTAYKIYKVQKDTSMIRERRHSRVNVEQERSVFLFSIFSLNFKWSRFQLNTLEQFLFEDFVFIFGFSS